MMMDISIHALLAESDSFARPLRATKYKFLSTLSLRRATDQASASAAAAKISIHALLAESDFGDRKAPDKTYPFLSTLSLRRATPTISITILTRLDFYPRSPCGERQFQKSKKDRQSRFLSTLSLRRATRGNSLPHAPPHISIHALLAESDDTSKDAIKTVINFYPRSPCGERREH